MLRVSQHLLFVSVPEDVIGSFRIMHSVSLPSGVFSHLTVLQIHHNYDQLYTEDERYRAHGHRGPDTRTANEHIYALFTVDYGSCFIV